MPQERIILESKRQDKTAVTENEGKSGRGGGRREGKNTKETEGGGGDKRRDGEHKEVRRSQNFHPQLLPRPCRAVAGVWRRVPREGLVWVSREWRTKSRGQDGNDGGAQGAEVMGIAW